MKQYDLETKLTPAAREALNELVDEYRTQVLFGAEQSASSYFAGDVKEISVSNIFESVNKNKTTPYSGSKVGKLLEIYQVAGILITFVALIYLLVGYKLSMIEDLIPILGFALGISLNVAAYVYIKFRSIRRRFNTSVISKTVQPKDLSFTYIQIWREVELAIRDLAATELGESNAKASISQLMNKLANSNLLTSNDIDQLKKLLQTRNRIVHESKEVDTEDAQNTISTAYEFLEKIKGISRSTG